MDFYKVSQSAAGIFGLILVAACVLIILARWDGRIDEQERQHEMEFRTVMKQAAAYHEAIEGLHRAEDSLAAVDAALAEQEKKTVQLIAQLDELGQTEEDSLESTPVSDLLPQLRLRPITHLADTLYATDEVGVRFLAGRMLALSQSQRATESWRSLAGTRLDRINTLVAKNDSTTARADSAQARVDVLQPLLEESERLRKAKGKWLGFIPKPPPELAFVGGIAIGLIVSR